VRGIAAVGRDDLHRQEVLLGFGALRIGRVVERRGRREIYARTRSRAAARAAS